MAAQNGAYKVALGVGTGNAGVLNLANPEGVDLIVTRLVVNTTTPSTGAANIDAGIGASGASADNLIDGQAVGTAAKVLDNVSDGGTNGKARQKWAAADYLTITASADPAGLVGHAYVEYVRV